MDDRLFDVFTEDTDVPKCVQNRIDETLEMLESVNYENLENTGNISEYKTMKSGERKENAVVLAKAKRNESSANSFRKHGKKKWKRSLVLSFAAGLL